MMKCVIYEVIQGKLRASLEPLWAVKSLDMYSATKQESNTLQNHYFGLYFYLLPEWPLQPFLSFYKTSFSPCIANREAIHVWSTFQAFFTVFG